MSILESHSFEVPAVAYCIDDIPELIANDVDGYLVDESCEKGLLNAIVKLLENQELDQFMGVAGRNKIHQRFTIDGCAKSHSDIFLS